MGRFENWSKNKAPSEPNKKLWTNKLLRQELIFAIISEIK